jgi:hypothetical protein
MDTREQASRQRSVMKHMLAKTAPKQSKVAAPAAVSTAAAKRNALPKPIVAV